MARIVRWYLKTETITSIDCVSTADYRFSHLYEMNLK